MLASPAHQKEHGAACDRAGHIEAHQQQHQLHESGRARGRVGTDRQRIVPTILLGGILTGQGAPALPRSTRFYNGVLFIALDIQKFRNVANDPRVTVTVFDAANPYRYVEARGRVTSTTGGDEARANIDDLSQKYMGAPYGNPIGTERVILHIDVDRVHKNNV